VQGHDTDRGARWCLSRARASLGTTPLWAWGE
jgi:hypothetical protein